MPNLSRLHAFLPFKLYDLISNDGFHICLSSYFLIMAATSPTVNVPNISKQIKVLDKSLTKLASSIGSITLQSNRLIQEFNSLKQHIRQLEALQGKPSDDTSNNIHAKRNQED